MNNLISRKGREGGRKVARSDGRYVEYEDEDCVFEFGHDADAQKLETHNCMGGASRYACRLGYGRKVKIRKLNF